MSKTVEMQLIQVKDGTIKSHRQRVEQTRERDSNELIYLALRVKNASQTLKETDDYST
ncbi:MAG TPA: hypothetical protein VFR24_00070 [Candidatus Angelobacter sp.]|nr:hypothetical protein [Candidatus Angelobacter sp.]